MKGGLSPREIELQKMRLRGRAEKQARLERKPDTSDIPEAGEKWFKNARVVTPTKPEVIDELKLTMKRKVYVKRKKPIRPARRAKAPR